MAHVGWILKGSPRVIARWPAYLVQSVGPDQRMSKINVWSFLNSAIRRFGFFDFGERRSPIGVQIGIYIHLLERCWLKIGFNPRISTPTQNIVVVGIIEITSMSELVFIDFDTFHWFELFIILVQNASA